MKAGEILVLDRPVLLSETSLELEAGQGAWFLGVSIRVWGLGTFPFFDPFRAFLFQSACLLRKGVGVQGVCGAGGGGRCIACYEGVCRICA